MRLRHLEVVAILALAASSASAFTNEVSSFQTGGGGQLGYALRVHCPSTSPGTVLNVKADWHMNPSFNGSTSFAAFNVNCTVDANHLCEANLGSGGGTSNPPSGTGTIANAMVNNSPINVTVNNPNCWSWNFNAPNAPAVATTLVIDMSYGAPPRTSHFKGSIGVNCPTVHQLSLTVDGVVKQLVSSSNSATYASPSVATVEVVCTETDVNCTVGKSFYFSVDGAVVWAGTISFVGTAQNVDYFMHPQVFDCAGPVGTAKFHGVIHVASNAGPHTFTLTITNQLGTVLGGGTKVSVKQSTPQDLVIDQSMSSVEQTTRYQWKIDGKAVSGNNQIDPFQ